MVRRKVVQKNILDTMVLSILLSEQYFDFKSSSKKKEISFYKKFMPTFEVKI